MRISAEHISWRIDHRLILDDVSIRVDEGEVVGIVGPNGSGKTSLLRCLAGICPVDSGAVVLGDTPLGQLAPSQRAQHIAVVGQNPTTEIDLTVTEVVALGRIPRRGRWGGITAADTAAIAEALRRVEGSELANRRWSSLSGGQRQRVQLARAFAQDAEILLLDEPTNHLDIRSQLHLMTIVGAQRRQTTAIVLHDLQLAAGFCDRIVILDDGRIVADAAPAQALTEELVGTVFGIDVGITRDGSRLSLSYRGIL